MTATFAQQHAALLHGRLLLVIDDVGAYDGTDRGRCDALGGFVDHPQLGAQLHGRATRSIARSVRSQKRRRLGNNG